MFSLRIVFALAKSTTLMNMKYIIIKSIVLENNIYFKTNFDIVCRDKIAIVIRFAAMQRCH